MVSLATLLIVLGPSVTPSNTRGEIGMHCNLARLTSQGLIREYARFPVSIKVEAKVYRSTSASTVIPLLLISFLKDAHSFAKLR
jgi:hypothetical protein